MPAVMVPPASLFLLLCTAIQSHLNSAAIRRQGFPLVWPLPTASLPIMPLLSPREGRGNESGDGEGSEVSAVQSEMVPTSGEPVNASAKGAPSPKSGSCGNGAASSSPAMPKSCFAAAGHLARVREDQNKLQLEKKRVAQDIRNAERKRSRCKNKAKLLSDQDMLDVLRMRIQAKKLRGGLKICDIDPAIQNDLVLPPPKDETSGAAEDQP